MRCCALAAIAAPHLDVQPGHLERATRCNLTSTRFVILTAEGREAKQVDSMRWACSWHSADGGSGVTARVLAERILLDCRSHIRPFT